MCGFEGGSSCGYVQEPADDFDWKLNSGPTPTANTGPSVDKTMGTDYGTVDLILTISE